MNVWLVTIGEPLPLALSKDDRLHRTGQFAHFLASRGHHVVWWTSAFDHFRKRHHFEQDTVVPVASNLIVCALKGCGYARNISLSRFKDHTQIARKFSATASQYDPPDVIVAALPTIELCQASVEYGRCHGVPVVLDMRDMWPDVIVDAVPKAVRLLGRMMLSPLYRQARHAFGAATAIIGITEEFVDWGLRRGGRRRGPLDRAFFFAYEVSAPSADKLAAAEAFWDGLGVSKREDSLTICYFGNVSAQLDLTHIIEAARQLHQRQRPVRFILCGSGERLDEYRQRSQGLPNLLLPGWVDGAQIWSLMRRSNAGLDPLPDRYDFLATINNKAVEYLSAGLPVISSPREGVLCDLLKEGACGLSYSSGSTEELVGVMEKLLADRAALAAMSAQAAEVFARHFKATAAHERMEEFLTEVTNSSALQRAESKVQ